MKHRSKKPLIIVLSCLAALLIAAACLWFFWLKDLWAAAGASPVYVQSVAEIAGLNLGSLPRYSGVVEPQATYSIQKDDTKTVAEIYVTEGDQVNPGDALFRYDTEELQLQLDQAELDLEGIENQITTLENQKDDLEDEKKKASEDEQYSYTVQIQAVELQIKTQEYNSDTKQQEIDKLEDSINNAEVFSEVEGVIREVNETPATDANGQQKPFITILSSGEFRVKGTISELNIGSLYQGQAVTVHSRVDESVWQGVVDTIETEPTSDQNNGGVVYYGVDGGQQSSKYNFYVTLSSREGLILGQHVYIQPDLGLEAQPEGLWLPSFYIAHDEDGSFVWAQSEDGTLEKRSVILGDYDSGNDRYEIRSGVEEGDFIAQPKEDLIEGAPTTSNMADVPVEDPSLDDGSAGGVPEGSVDGGTADGGTMDGGAVDPGMAVPYDAGEEASFSEDGTVSGTEEYSEDGTVDEGDTSMEDTLDGSPMEGLAR